MSEYVDVDIIENGKVIGTFKCLHVTEEKKDEEKADKYAEEWLDKERDLIIEDFLTYEGDDFLSNIFKKIKRAYVDGYHECQKEQWHDLRKDPTDLPEVSPEIEKTNGSKVYAIFKDRHYYLVDRAALKHYDDVIAWCELPQFKESE